jgi:hypothetical protein
MTLVEDPENSLYIVMQDGIDVALFNNKEEAQNFINNAN